jgi:hypothetical protein
MSIPAPANFTDPTADWKCYPGEPKAIRLSPSGDPECITRAGRERECVQSCWVDKLYPPKEQGAPLTCGDRHSIFWKDISGKGLTGYEDKRGWCTKYKTLLTPTRDAYMSKIEAERKAREAEETKKRMEAEAELKRMAATREDLKTPWQCLPGMTAPMRLDKNGKYECYSENGKDCAWQQDLNACTTYAATLNTQQASLAAASNSPGAVVVQAGGSLVRRGGSGNKKGALNKKKGGQVPNAPLECTPENLADPNHWCYKSKAALTLPAPQAAVDMATQATMPKAPMENPLRFMPIPERCKAYENLVNTGTDAEKEQYRQWAAAECLPHYNSLVKEAESSQTEKLSQYTTQIGNLRNQVRACRNAFNLPDSKGKIVSAWYGVETGSDKNSVDVTNVLQKMYDSGTTNITVSSSVFGDPAPGVAKYLFISYTPPEDQAVYKYKIPENKVVNIQFPDLQMGGGIKQRAGAELRAHMKGKNPVKMQSGGGSDYQYWHGVDAIGADIRRSPNAGNVPALQTECNMDPRCVAFNTKGVIKGYTQERNFIPMKNAGPQDGLYVNLRKHNSIYGFGPGPQGRYTTIETGLDAGPADFAAYPPYRQPRVQVQRGGQAVGDYLEASMPKDSDVKPRCKYTETKDGYEPANLFDGAYATFDQAKAECDKKTECKYIFEFTKEGDKPSYHLGNGALRKTKLQSPPFKARSTGCDAMVLDETTEGTAGLALAGPQPVVTDKRYMIENHKDYPTLMKRVVPKENCPDMKDYVHKDKIREEYNKTIRLIQDLQKMNSTYKTDIKEHPDYQFLMNKYACKSPSGEWIPCSSK